MQPRIIPREEHGISRRQISSNALHTLYRLHENGFIAYLVGGCVRDLLLGRTPKDFDIVTDAAPGQIKHLFRNSRIIGRRFRLVHLHFQDEVLEVSTFRAAGPLADETEEGQTVAPGGNPAPPLHLKDDAGMVLRDNLFGTPEEDALRRDFTINALCYNIADFSVIDYADGMADLQARLIRPIGDAAVRFTEDPVRMIRAVRFAGSHSFEIEPATWKEICRLAPTIVRAAPARLYEETLKLFLLGAARPVFSLLEKSSLLIALFPWLGRKLATDQELTRVLQTNMEGLDRLQQKGFFPSPPLFLALLFGSGLETEALARNRDGVPYLQAQDAVCGAFLEELNETVSVPGRIGSMMCRILALQPSLRRMPPRRPTSLARRPEFAEALTYMLMTARNQEGHKKSLEWWKVFMNAPDAPTLPVAVEPVTRRRKKRRRPRSPEPINLPPRSNG